MGKMTKIHVQRRDHKKTCKGQGNCYTKIMMNGYTI